MLRWLQNSSVFANAPQIVIQVGEVHWASCCGEYAESSVFVSMAAIFSCQKTRGSEGDNI